MAQVVRLTNLLDGGEEATKRRKFILAPLLRMDAIDKSNMNRSVGCRATLCCVPALSVVVSVSVFVYVSVFSDLRMARWRGLL